MLLLLLFPFIYAVNAISVALLLREGGEHESELSSSTTVSASASSSTTFPFSHFSFSFPTASFWDLKPVNTVSSTRSSTTTSSPSTHTSSSHSSTSTSTSTSESLSHSTSTITASITSIQPSVVAKLQTHAANTVGETLSTDTSLPSPTVISAKSDVTHTKMSKSSVAITVVVCILAVLAIIGCLYRRRYIKRHRTVELMSEKPASSEPRAKPAYPFGLEIGSSSSSSSQDAEEQIESPVVARSMFSRQSDPFAAGKLKFLAPKHRSSIQGVLAGQNASTVALPNVNVEGDDGNIFVERDSDHHASFAPSNLAHSFTTPHSFANEASHSNHASLSTNPDSFWNSSLVHHNQASFATDRPGTLGSTTSTMRQAMLQNQAEALKEHICALRASQGSQGNQFNGDSQEAQVQSDIEHYESSLRELLEQLDSDWALGLSDDPPPMYYFQTPPPSARAAQSHFQVPTMPGQIYGADGSTPARQLHTPIRFLPPLPRTVPYPSQASGSRPPPLPSTPYAPALRTGDSSTFNRPTPTPSVLY
ncbi:hypothetical protein C8J56DRAFT_949718 [Mycena floridula]|nr:hypothetical protein C8J56DRAFT_949718 [Mycena floridula]